MTTTKTWNITVEGDSDALVSSLRKRADARPRAFELRSVEWRENDDGSFEFEGHAAVFDSLSENLGGFREQIKRGAFKDVLKDDVRFLVNHDSNLLLARTTNKTLKLSEDPTGLKVRADIAPTSYAKDLKVLLERGDMSQMSFAFSHNVEDEWEEDEDGRLIRTIKRFKELFDVSAVTYPAYPATDAGVRALQKLRLGQGLEDEERAAIEALLDNSTMPDTGEQAPQADAQELEREAPESEERAEDESTPSEGGLSLAAAKRRLRLAALAD